MPRSKFEGHTAPKIMNYTTNTRLEEFLEKHCLCHTKNKQLISLSRVLKVCYDQSGKDDFAKISKKLENECSVYRYIDSEKWVYVHVMHALMLNAPKKMTSVGDEFLDILGGLDKEDYADVDCMAKEILSTRPDVILMAKKMVDTNIQAISSALEQLDSIKKAIVERQELIKKYQTDVQDIYKDTRDRLEAAAIAVEEMTVGDHPKDSLEAESGDSTKKVKKTNGTIYLLQFVDRNGEEYFKVGKTTQKLKTRLAKYKDYVLLHSRETETVKEVEDKIIKKYDDAFKKHSGKEWFTGDKYKMILIIDECCC